MELRDVDATIYLYLREAFVAAGFMADVSLYAGNEAGYIAAIAAVDAANGWSLDFQSFGAQINKGDKSPPKLTLRRNRVENDTRISHRGVSYHEEYRDENGYVKFRRQLSATPVDITYYLRLISSTEAQERAILSAIYGKLGRRQDIRMRSRATKGYLDRWALIEQTGEVPMGDEDILERVIRFTFKSVYLDEEEVVLATNISPVIDVDLGFIE